MADSQPRTPAPTPARHPFRVEGHDPKPEPKPSPRMPGGRRFWIFLLVLLVANYVIGREVSSTPSREQVPYSYFLRAVQSGNVSEVTATGDTIQGTFKHAAKAPNTNGKPSTRFQTERPSFASDSLGKLLEEKHVVINANPIETAAPLWQQVLLDFGPTLLIVGVFVLIFRGARRMTAGGALGGFGRSRAKRYEPESTAKRVTFEDVAGIDEAEEELVEVVDFLRNPDRYTRLGATVPKGVLLSGLPGTGKTLLARAVAGEAGVPFFSISASEFIEAIVGVGASRVRDLFVQAKLAAPAIVFIDELDAIGRARGGSSTIGGHDEREQTLNQILTEMDGFSGTEGVIVIASTNRPEVLDSALLRPGRFDRRVTVNPPDQTGRRQILEVHTRGMPLGPDVDLDSIASSTPGMVGADLRNLVNESALTAARRNHDHVMLADFTDSLERIVLGAERADHPVGRGARAHRLPRVRPRPARHAATRRRPRAQDLDHPPRDGAGRDLPEPGDDRYGYTVDYLLGRLVGALGGRAAEQLIYGEITTGAESDLEQATRIARQMAGRWGMSERIGPVSVLPGPNDQPTLFPGAGDASERTREMVDEEVRRILEECERTAMSRARGPPRAARGADPGPARARDAGRGRRLPHRGHRARAGARAQGGPDAGTGPLTGSRRPLVGAALVDGGVDLVPDVVGLGRGQRPGRVTEHQAHEDVLLARPQADAGDRGRRQRARGRLADHGHLLDGVDRLCADAHTDAVAQLLGGHPGGDGDRDVPDRWWHRAHLAVGVEAEHLCGHAGIGGAQEANVGDALPQHHRPVEADAECQARPARGVEPGGAKHVPAGETALEQLDPGSLDQHLHLAPLAGVRMRCRERPVRRIRQHGRDDQIDHLLEVGGRQGRVAPHPPQVELVRLADVQAVDHVAPVDEPGTGDDEIEAGVRTRDVPERPRDHRRGVRAQQPAVVEVAGVPRLARRCIGRIAEQLIVLRERHDRA